MLQVTVRANDEETREQVIATIGRIAVNIGKAHGLPDTMPVEVKRLSGTPTTNNDPALARRLNAALARELGESVMVPFQQKNMGAEDFTYFVAPGTGVPGYYFAVGGTTPERIAAAKAGGAAIAGHHSPLFQIAPRESVVLGTRAMVAAVLDLAPAK
ncbi:MAG: M20/M25/M40 family metallo-hydrolase [Erythrobacter sp.]